MADSTDSWVLLATSSWFYRTGVLTRVVLNQTRGVFGAVRGEQGEAEWATHVETYTNEGGKLRILGHYINNRVDAFDDFRERTLNEMAHSRPASEPVGAAS